MKFKKWYFIIVGTLIPVSLIVIAGIYIYFSLVQGEKIEWWFIAILGMMMLMSIVMFRFMLNSVISIKIVDETAAFEKLNGKQVILSLKEIILVKKKTNYTLFYTTSGKKLYSYNGVSKIKVAFREHTYDEVKGWEFPNAIINR